MNLLPTIFRKRPAPTENPFATSPVPGRAAAQAAVPQPPRELSLIIRPNVRDRWQAAQLSYFTPQIVENTFRGALSGNLVAQWQMMDLMEATWPELSTCLNELKDRAVAEILENYNLKAAASTGQKPTPEAERRRHLVEYNLRNMQPAVAADENDYEDTLRDMADAVGKAISVLEMHFPDDPEMVQIDGKPQQIIPLRATRWVHPRYYGYPSGEGQRDELMLNAREVGMGNPAFKSDATWTPFPPDKFIISVFKQKSGHPLGGSLLRTLGFWWAASNFTWEWFLNFVQIFGVPLRVAKVDPNASPAVKTQVDELLAQMGACGYIRVTPDTEIEIKDAMKSGDNVVHKAFLEYIDQICRKKILGQTLTGGEGQHGTQALGTVHKDVRDERVQGTAKRLVKFFNRQAIPAICRINFGDTSEMPFLAPPEEEDEDPLVKIQRDQIFTQIAPMGREEFYSRHGVKPPDDGEETIGGPKTEPLNGPDTGGEPPPKPVLAAEAKAASPSSPAFDAAALHLFIPAVADDLKHALGRLARILAIGDDGLRETKLRAWLAQYPQLKADTLADPKSARALQQILSTALVNGLAANPRHTR